VFVTQCLERSLHRTRATPATAPVWDDLRVLLAVHRGKSFLSASKALSVATSTVARRIEAFERALGRPLVLSGNGGTAIDADAPSLIALAKQMELGFDALLRAPDAQRITGAVRDSRILAGARRTSAFASRAPRPRR
jgi:DNA-binding transcriptional LysR family regulator